MTREDRFNLVRAFVIASSAIVLFGMAALGLWVSARIENAVSENAATVAALRVDGIVGPLAQSLQGGAALDEETRRLLDDRLARGVMSEALFAFKIWLPDGTVVYASNGELVGRRFEIGAGLASALRGEVYTEFNRLTDPENEAERKSGVPLLEIYSPIRDAATGAVIGVVEFYDAAAHLSRELREARLQTWLVVGAVTVGMLAMLFGVILRGGRVITSQRSALRDKIQALSFLLEQNGDLRGRVDKANRRTAEINERQLRRISADLHDGPMQLLAYASLRLNAGDAISDDERRSMLGALGEALGELRHISRGLTMPELEGASPAEAARRAVVAHRNRSDMTVGLEADASLKPLPPAETICIYRFVQEGLNNADRHAGGSKAAVSVTREGDQIVVRVRDNGIGFDLSEAKEGLGLSGLRERVRGLGGTFEVNSAKEQGTTIVAMLPADQKP
ncbi:MAG: sensor histidine kinase [Mesorhizobium sp.]|nr:sensor histidine kinase [Mesorhizobium sp.]MBL8576593.1 sensor histidine kinase [Mesorhizobium sp.]